MSDISAAERRLSAALDRIDYLIEAAQSQRPAAQSAPAAPNAADDTSLEDAQQRLLRASDEIARLAGANDQLVAANCALIEAQEDGGDLGAAVSAALKAEVSALRAARAAEQAQVDEIMAEVERILGADAAQGMQPVPDAPYETDVARAGERAEIVRFDIQLDASVGDDQQEKGE